ILANFAVEAGLAAILGASAEMDTYLAAVVVPEYLILLLQAGIQFSLVPVLVRQLDAGHVKQVFGLVDAILAALVLGFLGIFAIGLFNPGKIALLLAPGFSTAQTDAMARLLPVISPLTAPRSSARQSQQMVCY
ncbi:MAG: lipid II flippase MurJ, partial [bacterium]